MLDEIQHLLYLIKTSLHTDNSHFISVSVSISSLFFFFREFGGKKWFLLPLPFFYSLSPRTFFVSDFFSYLKQTFHSSGWHTALNFPNACFASNIPMIFALHRQFAARRVRDLGYTRTINQNRTNQKPNSKRTNCWTCISALFCVLIFLCNRRVLWEGFMQGQPFPPRYLGALPQGKFLSFSANRAILKKLSS